ncbi:MAG: hypothetical protein ACRDBX_01045 [Erysipelotrichaceae bacterium]
MEQTVMLNASPRLQKSNSLRYAHLLNQAGLKAEIMTLTKQNHQAVCDQIAQASNVVLVFPLYADGIPASLLRFLTYWQNQQQEHKPLVHVVINCGFIEPMQNEVCLKMMALFCKQSGLTLGSTLSIGGGEAILDTPFSFLVKRKMRQLARAIHSQQHVALHVSMPLTKRGFVKASTGYWLRYGKRYNVDHAQMQTMHIE